MSVTRASCDDSLSDINEKYCTQELDRVISDPKEFAREVGISLSAAYNYKSGRIPDLKTMDRIAQYCDRTIESFLRPC